MQMKATCYKVSRETCGRFSLQTPSQDYKFLFINDDKFSSIFPQNAILFLKKNGSRNLL